MVIDHKGKEYKSFAEMAKAYGISNQCLWNRINKYHYSLEEALTRPIKTNYVGKKRTMNNGEVCEIIKYSSSKDIDIKFENGVIIKNTRMDYFTKGILHSNYRKNAANNWNTVQDFRGRTFRSVAQMCQYYGTNTTLYKKNLNNGMSQKEALLYHPCEHRWNKIEYKGREYSSIKALAKELGVADGNLRLGINKGLTIDEILDFNYRNIRISNIERDYEGKIFPSKVEMCRAHGVSYGRYKRYIKMGYSKEEALNPNFTCIKSVIGVPYLQKNGLALTATDYVDSENVKAVWEDEIETVVRKTALTTGAVAHPLLNMKSGGNFHGYKIIGNKYIRTADKEVYYLVITPEGNKTIMTPQQMIANRKDSNEP